MMILKCRYKRKDSVKDVQKRRGYKLEAKAKTRSSSISLPSHDGRDAS